MNYRQAIERLIELACRYHYNVDEDNWYSCPQSPGGCADEDAGTECNCGADKHNSEVDKLAKFVKEKTDYIYSQLRIEGDV